MNLKRAVIFGVIIWVVIFFEVCILIFGFRLTRGSSFYNVWHFSLAGIIVAIASWFYFEKAKKNLENGILAGIIFMITGCVLDAIITVPLFIKNYRFFIDRYLWVGLIEGIVVAALVGSMRKRIG